MTNDEAITRIQEKLRYTRQLIIERPEERANFYRSLDCDAFEVSLAALQYTEEMRLYEASQSSPL